MKNDTGQRNLGSLTYNTKCKLEKEAKKVQQRLRGGRMRFCEDWKTVNSIDKTRTFQLIINSMDKL